MEGPPEKRRTFRKNDPFPGRFPRWGSSRSPKVPFWWMAKARGGTGRHEATCHPRLGGACEAMALRREGRRGSPVPPWLAGSNKSRRVQQGQTGSRECCPGSPGATRADACSKGRARIGGGAGRHEATCHPRLGGACEAMALRREGRRGSPVLPWLAGSNKSRRVQQGQTGAARADGRGGGPGREAGRGGMRRHATPG